MLRSVVPGFSLPGPVSVHSWPFQSFYPFGQRFPLPSSCHIQLCFHLPFHPSSLLLPSASITTHPAHCWYFYAPLPSRQVHLKVHLLGHLFIPPSFCSLPIHLADLPPGYSTSPLTVPVCPDSQSPLMRPWPLLCIPCGPAIGPFARGSAPVPSGPPPAAGRPAFVRRPRAGRAPGGRGSSQARGRRAAGPGRGGARGARGAG